MSEEIIERISVLETKLEAYSELNSANSANLMLAITELKQGIGLRVEQDGKDIAVLKSQYVETTDKVRSLEGSRIWLFMTIAGSFFTAIWAMIVGRKN